ncbi:MAG: hypothetical protein IJW31_04300 [Lentisphaeria bacterium]|nr:hypothetical protein [Lentisphaeria bacterium]
MRKQVSGMIVDQRLTKLLWIRIILGLIAIFFIPIWYVVGISIILDILLNLKIIYNQIIKINKNK